MIPLSLIIPVHNEEGAIGDFLNEALRLAERLKSMEVIVVDDGSTDRTPEILRQFEGIQVLTHPVCRGYGASLKEGIRAAGSPWVLIIDGDGSYSLSYVEGFLRVSGAYDMVVGRRQSMPYPGWALPKKLARLGLNILVSWCARRFVPDFNSGQRLFRRDWALGILDELSERFSFSCGLTLMGSFQGLKIAYLPVSYGVRQGQSKVHLIWDGFRTLRIILRLTLRHRPLWAVLPWLAAGALCYILLR